MGLGLGKRMSCLRATGAAVWLARGLALEARCPAEAIVAYRRAVAAQPSLADAHNNLGRLLHEHGDLAAAEACYRAALDARPIALHFFNLGVVLEDLGRIDEALVAYREALARDESFLEAHQNLARLLDERGRTSGSLADLQAAVRHVAALRRLRRTHA